MLILVKEIIVIIMILSLILSSRISEKGVKYLFVVCIGLNLFYRFEFISVELSRGFSILCKILELFLIIYVLKFSKKNSLSLLINIVLIFVFVLYLIPENVVLNNGGLSYIYRTYGTRGSNVEKGMENLEICNMSLLGISYILMDIIISLRMRKNGARGENKCR